MSSASGGVIRNVAKEAYNRTLRPHLPRKYGVYAGVTVRWPVLLDLTDHLPNYKSGLIDAIHENVDDGDEVTVYEAASEMLDIAKETTAIEGANRNVHWRHAVVGKGVDIFGEADGAESVAPRNLETGDVLLMDCEGAERSILEDLVDTPPIAIVETHPEQDVQTAETLQLLEELGYDVESHPYEPNRPRKRVLVGYR